jgi:hypothetical protein
VIPPSLPRECNPTRTWIVKRRRARKVDKSRGAGLDLSRIFRCVGRSTRLRTAIEEDGRPPRGGVRFLFLGRFSVTAPEIGPSESHRVQTVGEILSDGTVLELTRDPANPERVNLVTLLDGVLQTKSEILHQGRIYVPAPVDKGVLRALRLPTRVAPPEATRELFDDVHNLLCGRLGQLETTTTKLVFAIFASWCFQVLPLAPIMWIFAPSGSPKNALMQLLSCLCRRPLRLVGVNRADLRSLPTSLGPTLLLDDPDVHLTTMEALLASTRRGTYLRSRHSVVELFGPKFICSRVLPHGTALETDALRVALIPAAGQTMPLNQETEEAIAEEYQSRFLGYFLRNCGNVQIPKFDVSHFTLPVQDLARALGAAVVGDEDLSRQILPLLADKDEEVRAESAREFGSIVVEAILFFIHQGGWSKVRTESVAQKVSAIYKARGSDKDASPESVGRAIKRLGIPSGRINKAGNGVELTVRVSQLVHQLAVSYGVRAMQLGFRSGCGYCDELEAMTGQEKRNISGHVA